MAVNKILEKTNFQAQLRKAGFKATPARVTLLSILEKEKQPISPQDIIRRIRHGADPVTVYRALKNLKDAGLVRQVDFQHAHAHYELADAKDHHHLICVSCGIEGCEAELMGKKVLRKSNKFNKIQRHSLEFFGLCNKCAKK